MNFRTEFSLKHFVVVFRLKQKNSIWMLMNIRLILSIALLWFKFLFNNRAGLFPQNHGVTGNEVYDREKNAFFQYSYDLFHYNESVTPIWTLNERQGQRSGIMMWPGSEFSYNGQLCTFYKPLDKNMELEDRVDIMMSWLKDVNNPTNFVMVYIEQPDEDGHAYSPDSQQVLSKFASFL